MTVFLGKGAFNGYVKGKFTVTFGDINKEFETGASHRSYPFRAILFDRRSRLNLPSFRLYCVYLMDSCNPLIIIDGGV